MQRLLFISLLFLVVDGYAQPTLEWVRSSDVRGFAIDEDDSNVYLTTFDSVIRLDANGSPIWDTTYNFPGFVNAATGGFETISLNGDYIYINGGYWDSITPHNMIFKYNQVPDTVWTNTDVTGGEIVMNNKDYFYTARLGLTRMDLAGNLLWQIPSEGGIIDADSSGNVYTLGVFYDSLSNRYWRIAKFDTSGVFQWEYLYGPVGNVETATDFTVDVQGNAYLTGWRFSMCGFDQDYVTIKVNANGVEQWVSCYDGPGGWVDKPYAIGVDESGNVYVTGEEYPFCCPSQDTAGNIGTVKYDANGVEQWVRSYNGSGDGDDHGWAIAFDDSGYVYVGGHSYETGTGNDYVIIKYDGAGNELWVETYSGLGAGIVRKLELDQYGNIYVSGLSGGPFVKYCQYQIAGGCLPLAIYESNEEREELTIYPNPTTGTFTVQGTVASIQVYDLFGHLLLRSNKKEIDMGNYPAGIYIVRTGEAVRKLILH